MAIHPSAFIDKSAVIADSAEIAANAYIGKKCIIGDDVKIGFGAVVEEFTEIGARTVLSPNAHVGGAPQDVSYRGEETWLKIGEDCVIREFAPIHRATTKDDRVTVIGDRCMIMALAHIAHDVKMGNDVIVVSSSMIGGHCVIEDYAFLSAFSALHQFVRMGTQSMAGGHSHVSLDIPPYCILSGADKGKIESLNAVGMKRRGVSIESRLELKKALHIFLDKSMLLKDAKLKLAELTQYPEIIKFREFLDNSKRGVTRY